MSSFFANSQSFRTNFKSDTFSEFNFIELLLSDYTVYGVSIGENFCHF